MNKTKQKSSYNIFPFKNFLRKSSGVDPKANVSTPRGETGGPTGSMAKDQQSIRDYQKAVQPMMDMVT